jgi:uncharacterized membrane protein YeiH
MMNSLQPLQFSTLLLLDLAGTFVFALSGGATAIRERLDLFGVLVLSFAAGNAGGITRDVLIGAIPPVAIQNWLYVAISILAGLVMFFWFQLYRRLRDRILVLDAAGLGLFAVAGAQKALVAGLNPVAAALLGMVTGIGGGMVRDLLVTQVPIVLRSELYAVAALAGSSTVVIGNILHLPPPYSAAIGALLCFAIRMFAIRRNWNLPIADASNQE